MEDLPFMDALQKKHSKALGYFPRKQFEGYIAQGAVLVAEREDVMRARVMREEGGAADGLLTHHASRITEPLGYIISKDRYLKRDELGVVYQLCVVPGVQRGLIGATLVKAAFERAAYGCRLFCCWCAQDLAANEFWESLGFVPLAFRAGGRGKGKRRVHIFWQKRICEGDTETKWWYPFQTNSGAIREDRIVLPIPPGVSWRDVQPVELPSRITGLQPVPRALPDARHGLKTRDTKKARPSTPPPGMVGILVGGRIKYVQRPGYAGGAPVAAVAASVPPETAKDKPTRVRKAPAEKLDPKHLKAARELRDRYLEHVNRDGGSMLPAGKYDVSRALEGNPIATAAATTAGRSMPALPAPAAA